MFKFLKSLRKETNQEVKELVNNPNDSKHKKQYKFVLDVKETFLKSVVIQVNTKSGKRLVYLKQKVRNSLGTACLYQGHLNLCSDLYHSKFFLLPPETYEDVIIDRSTDELYEDFLSTLTLDRPFIILQDAKGASFAINKNEIKDVKKLKIVEENDLVTLISHSLVKIEE